MMYDLDKYYRPCPDCGMLLGKRSFPILHGCAKKEIEMINFSPSDVILSGMPLAGCYGKPELEAAATMLVRTMQLKGDSWKAVSLEQVSQTYWHDVGRKIEPVFSLCGNTAWRTDYQGLVQRGIAVLTDDMRFEFTLNGLEALRRYVVKQ
jgi:hypothetical protein